MISRSLAVAYMLALILFITGIHGLLRSRRPGKVIISVVIMHLSAVIFILLAGYRFVGSPVILTYAADETVNAYSSADPIAESMALVAALTSSALIFLMISLDLKLSHYKDAPEVKSGKGERA